MRSVSERFDILQAQNPRATEGRPPRKAIRFPGYEEANKAWDDMINFPLNLKSLIELDVRPTDIAATFGVDHLAVWRWLNGQRTCTNAYITIGVARWAERLKKEKAEQRRNFNIVSVH